MHNVSVLEWCTLHVSDGLSFHHQESKTLRTESGIFHTGSGGCLLAETVELMRQVYGDNCLSRGQIFRWYARFKSGVETIEDEARPGRPFSVRNEGLIAKVRERIQE